MLKKSGLATLTAWKKIPAITAGASVITLALCNATANANMSFSFASTDVDQPLWGDLFIDNQVGNIVPRGQTWFGIYPEAVSLLNVATQEQSFEFKNLDLGVVNRLTFGRDFVNFLKDNQEVATFTFENSDQFSSAANLEEVVSVLDGAKAQLTFSHYYRFRQEVVFSQSIAKHQEVPETSSVIGLLTVASCSLLAASKSRKSTKSRKD